MDNTSPKLNTCGIAGNCWMNKMAQRFWKLSVGSRRPWNDIAIKNKIAVMWGWGVINFDMKKFDQDGTRETFEKKIKEKFERSNIRQVFEFPGSKQLTDFYFLREKDIIFLYSKKLFCIDAIGSVKKSKKGRTPYYYDPDEYKERFEDDDNSSARQSHLVDVDWFYEDLKDPIEVKNSGLRKKISKNATIVRLDPPEAEIVINIAKKRRPEVDFSRYVKVSKEREEYTKAIEEDSEENIDKRLEDLKSKDLGVLEGEKEFREVIWRKRNRSIIEQAKSKSDYTCEVCGFNFEKKYGSVGLEYILAHHLKPIKRREKPEKTRLSDISIVCDNCHRMLHKRDPPYTLEELKKMSR